jgi:hypothetical protein
MKHSERIRAHHHRATRSRSTCFRPVAAAAMLRAAPSVASSGARTLCHSRSPAGQTGTGADKSWSEALMHALWSKHFMTVRLCNQANRSSAQTRRPPCSSSFANRHAPGARDYRGLKCAPQSVTQSSFACGPPVCFRVTLRRSPRSPLRKLWAGTHVPCRPVCSPIPDAVPGWMKMWRTHWPRVRVGVRRRRRIVRPPAVIGRPPAAGHSRAPLTGQ